jgi:flagellar biosynthesis GTPase FlhF
MTDTVIEQNLTTAPEPAKQEPTATAPEPKAEKKYSQEEMEQIIKDRLARKEESDKRKANEEKSKAEAEALAKNAEWEKLAKQREDELKAAKDQLAAKELEAKKRAIADKVKLPSAFADRLKGNSDEELEADALTILAALPKNTPGINPTNPGETGSTAETFEQKKARLSPQNGNIFAKGGGVIWPPKES